jgi:hypothetical protein
VTLVEVHWRGRWFASSVGDDHARRFIPDGG